MEHSRNRVTPVLAIILINLIFILFASIYYKFNNSKTKEKKLKLDDDLVQELYSYTNDEDVLLYSNKEYNIDNLPDYYIFSKATRFMTTEDIEMAGGQFKISYDSLDSAIKTAFGPDIKYNLSNINASIKTNFELDDNYLVFNVKYDKNTNSYIGTYTIYKDNGILVSKKLLSATKNNYVNLTIGYVFYKHDTNYKICNNSTCDKIDKEVDSLDNIDYSDKIVVSLNKASDDVYYYHHNK